MHHSPLAKVYQSTLYFNIQFVSTKGKIIIKRKFYFSERGRKVDSLESAIQEKDRTAKEARSLHEKTIEKFKFELDAVNKKCQEHQREIETVKQSSKDEKEAMSSTAIQLKVG